MNAVRSAALAIVLSCDPDLNGGGGAGLVEAQAGCSCRARKDAGSRWSIGALLALGLAAASARRRR